MRVRMTVHVRSADGRESAVLRPGDRVPDWAEVTNPAALSDEPDAVTLPAPAPAVEPEAPAAPKRSTRRKPAPAETAD